MEERLSVEPSESMEALTDNEEKVLHAIEDPAYHRSEFMKMPMYWPQVEAVKLVEKHMAEKSGKVLTIRSSRQTMKNECSATIHCRALALYREAGGSIVRTAPTHKPQIVNSKRRLEKLAAADPFIAGRLKRREGYIYLNGKAEIQFLSAQNRSNVEGATASLLLDIDEAHKVDKGKFEEAFGPMAAWSSCPIVMWGVAADQQDLLYEYRKYNEEQEPELNLQYDCDIWCELRPQYAVHVEERVKKLGRNHPIFQTQYRLLDIETMSGLLTQQNVDSILSSNHERMHNPRDGAHYVVVIDIGGEDDDGEVTYNKGDARHDATIVWVVEVDYEKMYYDYPEFRIVHGFYWVGKQLGADTTGEKGQQELILDLLNHWKPKKVVVDARGLGEQIAAYIAKRYANVEAYKATGDSVSEDCYTFLALANNDRVSIFRDDGGEDYRELSRELKHTKYEIFQHDKMRLKKPAGGGHIDMVKALTYLSHCVSKPFVRRTW